MKTLIVFDSIFGNTAEIAKAIGAAISTDVLFRRTDEVNPADLEAMDLLIVGAPTYGGKPTPAMRSFLDTIPESAVQGIHVAAFDTRLATKLLRIIGYAAGDIAEILKSKGGNLIIAPEGFIVKGKKGPLKEGETEHAANWGKELVGRL